MRDGLRADRRPDQGSADALAAPGERRLPDDDGLHAPAGGRLPDLPPATGPLGRRADRAVGTGFLPTGLADGAVAGGERGGYELHHGGEDPEVRAGWGVGNAGHARATSSAGRTTPIVLT